MHAQQPYTRAYVHDDEHNCRHSDTRRRTFASHARAASYECTSVIRTPVVSSPNDSYDSPCKTAAAGAAPSGQSDLAHAADYCARARATGARTCLGPLINGLCKNNCALLAAAQCATVCPMLRIMIYYVQESCACGSNSIQFNSLHLNTPIGFE